MKEQTMPPRYAQKNAEPFVMSYLMRFMAETCPSMIVWSIYWEIARWESEGKTCYVTPKAFMALLGCGWSTFQWANKKGEEAGLFVREGIDHYRGSWRITMRVVGFKDGKPIIWNAKTGAQSQQTGNPQPIDTHQSTDAFRQSTDDIRQSTGEFRQPTGVHHSGCCPCSDSEESVCVGPTDDLQPDEESEEGEEMGMDDSSPGGSLAGSPVGSVNGSALSMSAVSPSSPEVSPSARSEAPPAPCPKVRSADAVSIGQAGGQADGQAGGSASAATDPGDLAEVTLRLYRKLANAEANRPLIEAGHKPRFMLYPVQPRDLQEFSDLIVRHGYQAVLDGVRTLAPGWATKALSMGGPPKDALRVSAFCRALTDVLRRATAPPVSPPKAPPKPKADALANSLAEMFADGITKDATFMACQFWGIVLTAHYLASKHGEAVASKAIVEGISNRYASKLNDVFSATAKFDKYTAGLTLSDWRKRFASAVAKVGKLTEYPMSERDTIKVVEFVSRHGRSLTALG